MNEIDKPVLLLDKSRCLDNLNRMAEKLKKLDLEFRPHFKTHVSAEIGNWYRKAGIRGITVSSPGMASYFAEAGWDDITVAFPASPLHQPAFEKLSRHAEVTIFLNDAGTAEYYAENTSTDLKFYIEIDAGYNRSGVRVDDHRTIESILAAARRSEKLSHIGFYVHDGRTYHVKGKQQIEKLLSPVFEKLGKLHSRYPDKKICFGDTPSCSLLDRLPNVDQASPGNHIFYDLSQVAIGSCRVEQIAVALLCPVVQVDPLEGKVVIQGGAVHFSKDRMNWENREIYGLVTRFDGKEFNGLNNTGYLKSLSQEHGLIFGQSEWVAGLKPGDSVCLYPVHSCLTANLHDHYLTTGGERIDKRVLS